MEMIKEIYEDYAVRLGERIASCRDCPLYRNGYALPRIHTADDVLVMFIGEAPGFTETQTKRAFTGRSGKLLDEWIRKMGIRNYIVTNVVKHRPVMGATDRPPNEGEMSACVHYLREEIDFFDPNLIVTLGKSSLFFIY